MMELIQNQKHGWVMKKTARWPVKQLIARRHKHKMKVLFREEEKIQITEMNVCICAPEQGSILGKDDNDEDVKMRPFESLISSVNNQHMMVEMLIEDTCHDDFDLNNWCVNARVVTGEG